MVTGRGSPVANSLVPDLASFSAPDLTVAATHTGNFKQGDTGDTYTITVGNAGDAATSGTVSLVDTLPGGLTATAMSGTGWTVNLRTLTATRSDALAAGGSYPAVDAHGQRGRQCPGQRDQHGHGFRRRRSIHRGDTASD